MGCPHSDKLFPYYSYVKILNKIIIKNPSYCPYSEITCNLKHFCMAYNCIMDSLPLNINQGCHSQGKTSGK